MKLSIPSALLVVGLLAQSAPSTQPFRTGINLIEVDVVVRDRTGKPMTGLAREDFEVTEDGKPVGVETFTAVNLPDPPPPTPAEPDLSHIARATNDYPEDGRLFLLVLDDFHIRFDGRRIVTTKRIAHLFIDRLVPGDRAAIVSTSSRRLMSTEFTDNKALLGKAVDSFFPAGEGQVRDIMSDGPGGFTSDESEGTGPIGALKARFAMDKLSGTAKTMSMIPHRRKTVVLISEGMPFGFTQLMSPSASSSGAADVALSAMRDFISAAQRSNIAVYAFDPSGLEIVPARDRKDNLRSISEGTGGFATVETNDVAPATDRVFAESGNYYLLGYASPAKPWDGKVHKIRVRVSKPDVQVLAREGYIALRSEPKPAKSSGDALDALVVAPIETRGLPMHIAALPMPSSSKSGAALVVAVDVAGSAMTDGQDVQVGVTAVSLDDFKVKATDRIGVTLREDASRRVEWARVVTRLDIPPGRYQVRVAARRTDGQQQGSAFAEIQVPKFEGDLVAGGLCLGTIGSGGAIHSESIAGLFPIVPLANQTVPAALPVVAALPLKVGTKQSGSQLTISATLTRPDGQVAELAKVEKPAAEFAGPSGSTYTVALPPVANQPGDYRLKIEVRLGTRSPVVRELAFSRGNQLP